MSSTRSCRPAPYTENVIDKSMGPMSPTDSIPSDVADCATSDSGDCGSGSYSSRAPTPQCVSIDDIINDAIIPENDALSQEEICQYVDIARGLIVDAQGRAATPCSDLNANPYADPEMEMLGDSVQAQISNALDGLEWPLAPLTLPSTMTLDELPDSDLQYRPEYQLTQEWLEQTIKYLKDVDEERQVAAEREANMRAEIGADIEMN